MAGERYTVLQKLCRDVETPHSAVDWENCNILVFREVRHCGRALSLNSQYQFVDIKLNTQAVRDLLETRRHPECEVLTFSWTGQPDSCCCQSTCMMDIENENSHTYSLVLNKLCENGFKQLRQFAVMLFREFRCRLTKLRTSPIKFDFLHMDITEVEELQDNIKVLERNFKNLFLDDIKDKISLQLHIHVAETSEGSLEVMRNFGGRKVDVDSSHRFEDRRNQNPVRKKASNTKDTTKLTLIQQLDRQLELDGEDIEASYVAQKKEIEALIRDLRTLMQARRGKRDSVSHEDSLVTRDAGDGGEVQSENPSSNDSSISSEEQTPITTIDISLSDDHLSESTGSVESYKDLACVTVDVVQSKGSVNSSAVETFKRIPEPQATQHSLSSLQQNVSSLPKELTASLQSKSLVKGSGSEEGGAGLTRADGTDTFICFAVSNLLHTTDSDIQEMKKIAFEFLQGLEELTTRHGIQENIGIVAKEKTSWLKQKPTNNLKMVKKKIEAVTLRDTTSLSEALQEAVTFVEETGKTFKVTDDYLIAARLIVITNHTSLTHSIGSSFPLLEDRQEIHRLINTISRIDDETTIIPVGLQADRGFLQELATESKSDYIEGKEILKVCTHQHKWTVCAKMASFYKRDSSCLSGDDSLDLKFLLEMFASEVNGDDKVVIEARMKDVMMHQKHESIESPKQNNEYSNLPPLGSRVVRGKGWQSQNQDTEGPGTIVDYNSGGSVVVRWDNGHIGKYLYGEGDVFEVEITFKHPRRNTSDALIDIGCEVIRGPDWEAGNTEDGGDGCTGVVYRSDNAGMMRVRWYKTERTNAYKFGKDGKFEVLPREFTERREDAPDTEMEKTETSVRPVNAVLWQWENGDKWCSYTPQVSEKLEAAYARQSNGSCLIKRDKKSYRVFFKEMAETCLQDSSRRRIQRKCMTT